MIFPLALGLINADTLEIQRRISILQEQLKEKKGILADKNKIRNAWSAEIKGNYIRALELGILKDEPFPEESWQLKDYVGYLQRVPALVNEMKFPVLTDGLTNRVANYLARLRQNENEILNDLEEKTYRLSLLRSFKEGSTQYELAIHHQQSRLEPLKNGWLHDKLKKHPHCPVCGSIEIASKENLQTLIDSAAAIKEKILQINESKDILDREVTEIEKEIIELEKQLNSSRIQLDALGRQNDQIERQRKGVEEIFRYVGRIEQNLKNLNETEIDGELSEDITALETEIGRLQADLSKSNSLSQRDAVINRIGQAIVFYKRILQVEDAENPTEIDEKQLTLKIISSENREDYLWEIGSGSNWMGYHLAAILSLQEFFLALKAKNYTPTFVIFDQPSQAYFPDPAKLDQAAASGKKSDDLDRVKSIFTAFSAFLKRTNKRCQVIVLEHASREYWGEVELISQVGNKRWIKGDALIPQEWIDALS